nr:restriction endonuclease subunit S [Lactobacillus kefiranofaciens]
MDLAMRGKLVPQDPNDEPASVLLEKIKAEKAELIKEKKIKKTKPLPPITDDEKPFDIPDSWEWVRLGDVIDFSLGKTPRRGNSKYWEKGSIPWVSISDIGEEKYLESTKEKITPIALKDSFKNQIESVGTLLMSFKLSIGKVAILKVPAVHNEAIISVYPIMNNKNITRDYLYYLLPIISNSGYFTPAIKGKTLNKKLISQLKVPLPPLSEQSRIAAKIAQLFALLRKVETSTQQYAKLQTLLKSKVLDLAMRGKLVKQDPNDEPASVLLEKIKAEKQELIKEKKIKKTKSLPPITDGEKPFDIPDSWEWVRLGEICEIKGGKRVPKGRKLEDQVSYKPYIRVADMQDQSVNTDTLKYASKDIFNEISRYTISSKDVYFSIAGTIGKVGSIPKKLDGALLTENAAKLEFFAAQEMNKKFFIEMLSSDFIKEQHKEMLSKVAQPKLALIKLRKTIIPLPPVSEQKRVVGKILQIFSQ